MIIRSLIGRRCRHGGLVVAPEVLEKHHISTGRTAGRRELLLLLLVLL